jgi:hypothetical protein
VRLLIGSLVRQSPAVLEAFLRSLAGLNLHGLTAHYYLVDENDDPSASGLLREWAASRCATVVAGEGPANQQEDQRNEALVWQAARAKDAMIEYALAEGFDLLFLVESNLVLHPFTVQQLIQTKKPIVAEIVWSRSAPEQPERPQVWLTDQDAGAQGEHLALAEADQRASEWYRQLREPGLYPVGGLGACTLMQREALAAGCRFAEIYNLSLRGEDRHFSIRAAALGYQLWVDTTMPAYQISGQGDLAGVADYVQRALADATPRLVKQVAQAGLEAWGTSDWQSVTGLEGAEYLASNLRERQAAEAADLVARTKAAQSSARTRVEQVEVVDLDDAAGEALVRCWLVNEGRENGEAFADRLQALVVLVREERWLIGSVEFFPTVQAAAGEA